MDIRRLALRTHTPLLAIATLLLALSSLAPSPLRAQAREIVQVRDNLYAFRSNGYVAALLVTGDGIVATDPINEASAQWLKAEVARRFDQPVRYVVYSHAHADHVSGGEVFTDSATFIAHEKALAGIAGHDRIVVPDQTFGDRMSLRLGGETVNLHYLGPSHSDNVIVMEFPRHRALFVVDSININRLPYRDLPSFHLPAAIDFIRSVETMDFDILIPGHGEIGDRDDVVRHRRYFEALHAAVLDARRQGLTLAQAQASIRLDEFSDFGQYDAWLAENIAGAYRILDGEE